MSEETFTCDRCGGTFLCTSEEEALAEMRSIWGEIPPSERAVVCDGCFRFLDPENNPHLVEESMAEMARRRLSSHDG